MDWKLGGLTLAAALVSTSALAETRPKVSLQGVRADCVRSHVVRKFTEGGFSVRSANDYQLVFGKRSDSFRDSLLYGSRANVDPEQRVSVTLIPGRAETELDLIFEGAMVTNPGTGNERVHPMGSTEQERQAFQGIGPLIQAECPATASSPG